MIALSPNAISGVDDWLLRLIICIGANPACPCRRRAQERFYQRDPFDRMLIAQAMLENLLLVSNEQPFDAYGVGRLR
jgi:PIN domain nuclease of toxin-antitoxin system